MSMTIDEIRTSTKTMLAPADVCGLLGVSAYSINVAVKQYGAEAFPFPIMRVGTRVKIPRLQFLRFITGEDAERSESA